MADNFLERKRQDYEAKKSAWLKKKHLSSRLHRTIVRPEDESL